MRIVIEYDSCWQTGFMGDNPNKPIDYAKRGKTNYHSNKGFVQKFIATSKARGERNTPISDNTVLGVLCRLIGDQRKLFQAIHAPNFYFADIKEKISWELIDGKSTTELTYLTNKSDDRCAQSTWLGVIPDDNPWFFSEQAPLLWSVLYLNRNEILEFFRSDKAYQPISLENIDCRPTALLGRIEEITDIKSEYGEPWKSADRVTSDKSKLEEKLQSQLQKKSEHREKFESKQRSTEKQQIIHQNKMNDLNKKIEELQKDIAYLGSDEEISKSEQLLNKIVGVIQDKFPGNEYWSKGVLYPYRLYSVALYFQCQRLIAEGHNLRFAENKNNEVQIPGFSKRGFNGIRDLLNPMSGGRKKSVGTPCQIQKQSGQLEIKIDIDIDKAIELKTMIDNAGVSAFYLGKKGLAYVSHIDVR